MKSFAITTQTDWISQDYKYFAVAPTDLNLKGTHVILVTLSDGYLQTTYTLEIEVIIPTNKGPPYFKPRLSSLILRLPLNSSFSFELPAVSDPDITDLNPLITLRFIDPDLVKYVEFQQPNNLTFTLPGQLDMSKTYSLVFRVNDQSPYGPLWS